MDIKLKGGYSRMTGYTTESHPEYGRGFRDGQQSKQAEIDALKSKIEKLEIELRSTKYSADQCLSAMSISCAKYLSDNKRLAGLVDAIKSYLCEAPTKHVSQTAMLKVLDILGGTTSDLRADIEDILNDT